MTVEARPNQAMETDAKKRRGSSPIRWMSHDARWFVAVAQAFGIEAPNRLNQVAAREEGEVEARRIVRALRLPPAATANDHLLAQEIFIGFLGPELLDYETVKTGADAFEIRVQRCFAHENVTRAGVDDFSGQANSS